MNPRLKKGLIVAALHLAIVGSLGAKLLVDRATRPRVWARTAPIDPDHPLRGRYVRLRVEGEPIDFGDASDIAVRLTESKGLLAFTPASGTSHRTACRHATAGASPPSINRWRSSFPSTCPIRRCALQAKNCGSRSRCRSRARRVRFDWR